MKTDKLHPSDWHCKRCGEANPQCLTMCYFCDPKCGTEREFYAHLPQVPVK